MTTKQHSGFVLASLIITTVFVVAIGTVVAQLVINNFRLASEELYKVNAQLAADAGLDYSIAELNIDNGWVGSGGEVELINNGDMRLTFETTVTAGSNSFEKFVDSTGRTYVPASASSPRSTRKFKVDLRGLKTGGSFSVVTGVGGLEMSNNSKIVAGDIYVNGHVDLQNSSQIGLTTNSITLRAAHENCPNPPDASYPRLCENSDGEPISMSVNARIYGDVKANNQITNTHMSNPGLTSNIQITDWTNPPIGYVEPQPLPVHDRLAQITAVPGDSDHNLSSSDASCTKNNGTNTWEANTKINGDVLISKNCVVTIEGNVWITGDLRMTQSGTIATKEGLADKPNIMIDGSNGLVMRNTSKLQANISDNTGIEVITYYSTLACSIDTVSPCDVTGADLFNSRHISTIDLDNLAGGPESILYAKWSQVLINNSGDIGALVGQTVSLRNSGAITFGTSVPGPQPKMTWLIDTYKREY